VNSGVRRQVLTCRRIRYIQPATIHNFSGIDRTGLAGRRTHGYNTKALIERGGKRHPLWPLVPYHGIEAPELVSYDTDQEQISGRARL